MKQIILASISVFLIAISLNSCRKEKETIAKVIVVDAAQQPVAGATVRVYCPSATCANGSLNEAMDRTEVTNSSGQITLNYTEQYLSLIHISEPTRPY